MKKVAIMQPYLFPYIGYMNLVCESDIFVFYDDVNFIKKGWIHRNTILINGKEHMFSFPLSKVSQNKKINEIELSNFNEFKVSFINKIEHSYKKAPYFENGISYVRSVLDMPFSRISEISSNSVINFFNLLCEEKRFAFSSKISPNTFGLDKADRLIAITKEYEAKHYVNTIGGQKLYSKEYFKKHDIDLEFIQPIPLEYVQQNSKKFVHNLSVIDLLMNVDLKNINKFIKSYKIIK